MNVQDDLHNITVDGNVSDTINMPGKPHHTASR